MIYYKRAMGNAWRRMHNSEEFQNKACIKFHHPRFQYTYTLYVHMYVCVNVRMYNRYHIVHVTKQEFIYTQTFLGMKMDFFTEMQTIRNMFVVA